MQHSASDSSPTPPELRILTDLDERTCLGSSYQNDPAIRLRYITGVLEPNLTSEDEREDEGPWIVTLCKIHNCLPDPSFASSSDHPLIEEDCQ